MNNQKEIIPIILAADNNYAIPLGITILSILNNKNGNYDIEFFILEDNIEKNKKEEIESLVVSYSSKIEFLSVDKILSNNSLPERGYLRKIAYARIFIPELINREKVIYLDTDIIVDGELIELFHQKFDSAFLALKEPETEKILAKKNDPILHRYFNSGVLVIDTKKWKDNKITEKAIDFLNEFPEKIEYADQDALNYTCQDLWEEIDIKYNYEIVYNEPNRSRGPIVTHYIGNIKPWHYEYPNKIDKYTKYAQISPWKNKWRTKPTFKRIGMKYWMKFKLFLKTIPGLKKIITKIKQTISLWKK